MGDGTTSTNVLVIADWSFRVAYMYAGVEGSAHDRVLEESGLLERLPPSSLTPGTRSSASPCSIPAIHGDNAAEVVV